MSTTIRTFRFVPMTGLVPTVRVEYSTVDSNFKPLNYYVGTFNEIDLQDAINQFQSAYNMLLGLKKSKEHEENEKKKKARVEIAKKKLERAKLDEEIERLSKTL